MVTRALDANAIREIDPNLAPGFTRGLFFPDNGHTVNPLRLVQTLVTLFVEAGGKVERRKVARLRVRATARCLPSRCEGATRLAADTVVVATGIRSRKFAAALGDRVPLEAERGYHVMLPEPGRASADQDQQPRPHVRTDADGARRAHLGHRRVRGARRADGRAPRAFAPRAREAHVSRRSTATGAQFWMGSRPSTPDSLPVVDRASRARNVVYAFGHGHTGLTGAPMTAELVASIVTGARPPIDPAPFRADTLLR